MICNMKDIEVDCVAVLLQTFISAAALIQITQKTNEEKEALVGATYLSGMYICI